MTYSVSLDWLTVDLYTVCYAHNTFSVSHTVRCCSFIVYSRLKLRLYTVRILITIAFYHTHTYCTGQKLRFIVNTYVPQ